jgi:XTP/dITP diphosphohydrolase
VRSLVVATRNAHKAREIQEVLGAEFQILSLQDFPLAPTLIEDAATFEGNACGKSEQLAAWLQSGGASSMRVASGWEGVLADDSGLEVDALRGAPGVLSARFAALDAGVGGNSTDAENNAKLLRLLARWPAEGRSARFRCVLALTALKPERRLPTLLFSGTCEGRIGFEPRGTGGFGYDPLFLPTGYDLTFAELGADVKNRISHRAQALAQLRRSLNPQLEAP